METRWNIEGDAPEVYTDDGPEVDLEATDVREAVEDLEADHGAIGDDPEVGRVVIVDDLEADEDREVDPAAAAEDDRIITVDRGVQTEDKVTSSPSRRRRKKTSTHYQGT